MLVPRNRAYLSRADSINEHSFVRWSQTSNNTITNANQCYSAEFKLSDVVNVTDFSTLYDRYMITRVDVEFQLLSNPDSATSVNTTTAAGTNFYPRLWYYTDHDDAATPANLNEVKQVSRARNAVMEPNKVITVTVKPAILNQTYRTVATTGYSPQWNIWIDMAQTDVPHYGLKWSMDTNSLTPATPGYTYTTCVKYYFKCKDVR